MPTSQALLDTDKVVAYIERCQTPDGGFFFARVPPACGMDTYHAVTALQTLERSPSRPQAVREWLKTAAAGLLPGHPRAVFHLTQTGLVLGMRPKVLRRWAAGLPSWENDRGGFGAWHDLYVEVPSELETTCCAVATRLDLDLGVDRERVSGFVLSFQNPDGGFGGNGRSTLASTYYAVATLARLGRETSELDRAAAWLSDRAKASRVGYLEQLYWLVAGLHALGREIPHEDRAVDVVLGCQTPSGGFGRAHVGIATLEYTHYALEILRGAGIVP